MGLKPSDSAPITVAAALSLVRMRVDVISMSLEEELDCLVRFSLVSLVVEG